MLIDLLKAHKIISDQIKPDELQVILDKLQLTLENNVDGDLVELGCYEGTTSLFLKRLLNQHKSKKQLHVYDSFAGLPEKTLKDASRVGDQFKGGELKSSKQQLIQNFTKAGLDPPIIHKGWFSELSDEDVPKTISFAFLDGDYYESIKDSLKLVWPKMSKGGFIIIDDYQSEALPGVSRAVGEWLRNHPKKLKAQASLAIIGPF